MWQPQHHWMSVIVAESDWIIKNSQSWLERKRIVKEYLIELKLCWELIYESILKSNSNLKWKETIVYINSTVTLILSFHTDEWDIRFLLKLHLFQTVGSPQCPCSCSRWLNTDTNSPNKSPMIQFDRLSSSSNCLWRDAAAGDCPQQSSCCNGEQGK